MNELPGGRAPTATEAARAEPEAGAEAPSGARRKRGLFGGSFSRILRGLKRDRRQDELRDALEQIIEASDSEREDLAPDERRLVQNILRLHAVTVADVMVPRADIVAVEMETPLQRLIELVKQSGHSRFPVYRGSLDEIAGMVHVKDLIAHWAQRRGFALESVLRKVLFAAPSMRVLDLLKEMRITRIHLALVVDEYGGVDGLVTIENLVEEIVGEIEDEHDAEPPPTLVEEGPGVALADARVTIEDFERRFGRFVDDEERDEVDTLGGLVFYLANRVPTRGELIRHSSGIEFEVVDADPRRVRLLRVRNLPKESPDDDGAG
ncbi:MAG: HlyC/CorC family transporter [Rhodospirillaceae bacterium]|nr:HlyC/CorC family transporter [Rhodospirillaceae bacterium]